jgi:hypothetical protein
MGRSWSPRTLGAIATFALVGFVPVAAGCGAAAYNESSSLMQADESAAGYAASTWESSGAGYSEPGSEVLAAADRVAYVQDETTSDQGMVDTGTPANPEPAATTEEPTPGGTWDEIALPEVTPPAERMVIKNATMRIELNPPEEGPAKVTEIAKRFGGYVSASSETAITIRVPAAAFEEVLEAIAQIGTLADRQITGQDVTEEYYDLNIRLRNALAALTRYLELLERAQTVEEALLVEHELERVTLEIEQLRGKLRYLRDQVGYSTIAVDFMEEYTPPEESSPGPLGWVFYGIYLGVKWLFVWDEPGPGR